MEYEQFKRHLFAFKIQAGIEPAPYTSTLPDSSLAMIPPVLSDQTQCSRSPRNSGLSAFTLDIGMSRPLITGNMEPVMRVAFSLEMMPYILSLKRLLWSVYAVEWILRS